MIRSSSMWFFVFWCIILVTVTTANENEEDEAILYGRKAGVLANKMLRIMRKDPSILASLSEDFQGDPIHLSRNEDKVGDAAHHIDTTTTTITANEDSFPTYLLRAMASLGTIVLTFILSFTLVGNLEWFLRDVVHLQYKVSRSDIRRRINWLASHHFYIKLPTHLTSTPTMPLQNPQPLQPLQPPTHKNFFGNKIKYNSLYDKKELDFNQQQSVIIDVEEDKYNKRITQCNYKKPLGDYVKYNLLKIIYIFFASVLFISGILLALWFIHIDFILLIASLGIAAVIAMIHLSDFIRNLAAYVWVIFSDIASLGDVVEFNGTGIVGVIVQFNVLFSTFKGFKNTHGNSPEVVDINVPNNYFFLPHFIYRGYMIDEQMNEAMKTANKK